MKGYRFENEGLNVRVSGLRDLGGGGVLSSTLRRTEMGPSFSPLAIRAEAIGIMETG